MAAERTIFNTSKGVRIVRSCAHSAAVIFACVLIVHIFVMIAVFRPVLLLMLLLLFFLLLLLPSLLLPRLPRLRYLTLSLGPGCR